MCVEVKEQLAGISPLLHMDPVDWAQFVRCGKHLIHWAVLPAWVVCLFVQGFPVSLGWPGICYVDQAGFELIIFLLLTPELWGNQPMVSQMRRSKIHYLLVWKGVALTSFPTCNSDSPFIQISSWLTPGGRLSAPNTKHKLINEPRGPSL